MALLTCQEQVRCSFQLKQLNDLFRLGINSLFSLWVTTNQFMEVSIYKEDNNVAVGSLILLKS